VQWEDFSKNNALAILDRYRERVPSFNDDIQGTGAVALAGIYSACRVRGDSLGDQRVVIHGAGAAGLGIFRQLKAGLALEGLSEEQIAGRIAVLDSRGMLADDRDITDAYKREMAWPAARVAEIGLGDSANRELADVVSAFRPTVLIGASGQAGAFSEDIIRSMAEHTERPVVLPFSNPTSISEAIPQDIFNWTDGLALVATGSPFDEIEYNGDIIEIGQGNNVFIFPGIGLGVLLSEARVVSDAMISVSAQALADAVTDAELQRGLLFPSIRRLREVAVAVAAAVMRQAAAEGMGNRNLKDIEGRIEAAMWEPNYTHYIAAD
jgi:malate dehydrogenase (oxaloacetate-decarboxylating)